MARVLIPVQARTYNHNPRGSATAHVTMSGRNPFEGGGVVVHKGSAIPGMSGLSGLGEDSAGATPTSSSPSWMTGLLSSIIPAVTSVGTQLASARISNLYPPQTPQLQSQGAQVLPGQGGPQQLATGPQSYVVYPPAAPSKMPMILIGLGVVGLGVAFMMSKKRK